jgi:hypothetical protein
MSLSALDSHVCSSEMLAFIIFFDYLPSIAGSKRLDVSFPKPNAHGNATLSQMSATKYHNVNDFETCRKVIFGVEEGVLKPSSFIPRLSRPFRLEELTSSLTPVFLFFRESLGTNENSS